MSQSSQFNTDKELSSTSVQDLMNLIKSLYKIIEGLSARLEKFESESFPKSFPKDDINKASRNVSIVVDVDVVKEVPKMSVHAEEVQKDEQNSCENAEIKQKSPVHKNENPSRCLKSTDENHISTVHREKNLNGCPVQLNLDTQNKTVHEKSNIDSLKNIGSNAAKFASIVNSNSNRFEVSFDSIEDFHFKNSNMQGTRFRSNENKNDKKFQSRWFAEESAQESDSENDTNSRTTKEHKSKSKSKSRKNHYSNYQPNKDRQNVAFYKKQSITEKNKPSTSASTSKTCVNNITPKTTSTAVKMTMPVSEPVPVPVPMPVTMPMPKPMPAPAPIPIPAHLTSDSIPFTASQVPKPGAQKDCISKKKKAKKRKASLPVGGAFKKVTTNKQTQAKTSNSKPNSVQSNSSDDYSTNESESDNDKYDNYNDSNSYSTLWEPETNPKEGKWSVSKSIKNKN